MVERQRRDPQALKFKHHKRLNRVAEVQNPRMFKQIVTSGFIWRTVNRDRRANAPAQRK